MNTPKAVPRTAEQWVHLAAEAPGSPVFAFPASQRTEVLDALLELHGRPFCGEPLVLGRRVVFVPPIAPEVS
jgi:hypothetical protein